MLDTGNIGSSVNSKCHAPFVSTISIAIDVPGSEAHRHAILHYILESEKEDGAALSRLTV